MKKKIEKCQISPKQLCFKVKCLRFCFDGMILVSLWTIFMVHLCRSKLAVGLKIDSDAPDGNAPVHLCQNLLMQIMKILKNVKGQNKICYIEIFLQRSTNF